MFWRSQLKVEIDYAFEHIKEIERLMRMPLSDDTKKHLESELEIYKWNHSWYRQLLEEENARKFQKERE